MTEMRPLTSSERQLVETHLDLVPEMIAVLTRSCTYLSLDESEELTQIGYLALCRAAMGYDKNRPFKPYARVSIKHAIYDYWRDCRKRKERCCSLDAMLSQNDGYAYEQICVVPDINPHPETDTLSAASSTYLSNLEQRSSNTIQKGITALRLQQQGYKSTELAKLYGVPSNHVRAWQSKARKLLKQNDELYALLA